MEEEEKEVGEEDTAGVDSNMALRGVEVRWEDMGVKCA